MHVYQDWTSVALWYPWWEPAFSRSEEEVTGRHVGDGNEPGCWSGGGHQRERLVQYVHGEAGREGNTRVCADVLNGLRRNVTSVTPTTQTWFPTPFSGKMNPAPWRNGWFQGWHRRTTDGPGVFHSVRK